MGRGHYDRAAARARREAAQAVHVAPVPPSLPDMDRAAEEWAGPTTSAAPDLEAHAPVRLLAAHGYIEERFNRGVFSWREGEIITNPDEIAHLMARGARMERI